MKNSKLSFLPWVIWGLSALFYFYEFLLQVSPGVMVPDLMKSFSVNAHQLGDLAAIYFYVYAGMQIPVGMLLDRFGPHRLLTIACAICAAGSYLFASAHSIHVAMIGRALIGFGSAFAVVGCMKIIANWFPPNRFALMLGLILTIGMLGAIGGEGPLALMVNHLGWRGALHTLAFAGGVLSAMILLIVRDRPKKSATAHAANDPQSDQVPVLEGLKDILRSKQTWIASIYGALMFGPTSAFAGLWGVSFLVTSYGLSRPTAGGLISLIFAGWAIGSPLAGAISDYIARRKPTMVYGSIGALIAMTAIIYVPHIPLFLLGTLLFLFGFFSAGFLMAFPIVKEINRPAYSATAMGFINTLNMIPGAILQPVIGVLLDKCWNGTSVAGVPVYTTANFRVAFAVLPLSILIALISLPWVRETFCQPVKS